MELFFVLITSLLLAVLNQLHVITQWFTRPVGTYFTGIAHYFRDYFLYTDIMAQGASGTLWTTAHFTNEPMAKTWIYWFNALLGFLGNLIGLSPFATYNVSLFLLVVTLCLVWYKLTTILYPKSRFLRLTAWFFILTMSSFFSLKGSHPLRLAGEFWFSPAPAFNRLGGVPHQVLQTIVFIILAIVFSRFVTMKFSSRIKNYELRIKGNTFQLSPFILYSLFFILLTALAASANPIQMVLFVAAGTFLRSPRVIPLALIALPVILATNKAFELPVLSAAKAWENAQGVSVSLWQFILSMGPIALFISFGVKPFLKEKTPLRLLLFSYSALSILIFFSPIPKLLGTTSVRWLSPAAYGVLGILAAEGLATVATWLTRLFAMTQNSKHEARMNFDIVSYFVFRISNFLIALYLLLTIPSLLVQINSRANTSQLNHVPMTVIDALTWLKITGLTGLNPVSEHPVVLTDPALPYDVLVPTFTGLASFTGHPIHTLYPGVKESLRERFFSGVMTEDEKKKFLKDHRIRYIITKENGSIKISPHE